MPITHAMPLVYPQAPRGISVCVNWAPSLLRRPEELFDGYVFDLDGTLYLGESLLPGAARLLRALRELDRGIAFASNNPTRTPAQYVEKLAGLGVQAAEHEVVNSLAITVDWVLAQCPDACVFVIGEQPLISALHDAGVRLSEDPHEIDLVIASFDRTLEYRKLQIAFDVLWRREDTRLVATNPDPYCPTPNGGEPDAAAVIAALEASTGHRCELHFGKPGQPMMDAVTGRLGLPAERCLMAGDRLYTDVAAANTAGMRGALVLTGETSAQSLEAVAAAEAPDYILGRIDQLFPESEWERRGWQEPA
jgi:HAD superfamily hydrolase (TIGR01450 family)